MIRRFAFASALLLSCAALSAPAFAGAPASGSAIQALNSVHLDMPVSSIPECSKATPNEMCRERTGAPPMQLDPWIEIKHAKTAFAGVSQSLTAGVNEDGKIKILVLDMAPDTAHATQLKKDALAQSEAQWDHCGAPIDTAQPNEKPGSALRMKLWKCDSDNTVAIFAAEEGNRSWITLQHNKTPALSR